MLVLIPFLIWGEHWEGSIEWMKGHGEWAWAAGILLLVSDLVLPIPSTAVMAGLGYVYGPILGGLIGACGSFLAGAIGYGLCRALGQRAARRLLGEKDLLRGQRIFSSMGGWVVALSRWMPLLPEVIACMAGLTRMPAPTFFIALACGSLPLGFTFATIGSAGIRHPWIAILLSAVLPPMLWVLASRIIRKLHPETPGPKVEGQ